MARRQSVSVSLKTNPWVRRLGIVLRYAIIGAIWGAVALGAVLLYFTWDMPNPARAVTTPRRPAIRLYDQSHHLVARFGDAAGHVVLPGNLPAYVPGAFIAIEDRRFYDHGAFDLQGIARAAMLDVARRHIVQGGSTLTQQGSKTVFPPDQGLPAPKGQEAIIRLRVPHHYTREEILGIYL